MREKIERAVTRAELSGIPIAAAVLDALREPTDIMRSQGQWAISDNLTVSVCVENAATAERVWTRMIAAAKNGA